MTPKDLKALEKLLDMAKTYKTANCLTIIDAERVILQLREQPNTVEVSGIWLRFIEGKTQVLAEIDGKFRLLMEEPLDGNLTQSHQRGNRPHQSQRKSSPKRQDDCVKSKEDFTTQEFLSELRSLTPVELERLIRSYAP